jgi:glutamate synthase (NADPH/NADH) large chain
VDITRIDNKAILTEHLRGLINQHQQYTGSEHALSILQQFDHYLGQFKLVKPKTSDVKSLLGHISRSDSELRVLAQ